MKIQQVQSNLGFQSNKRRYISQESHEQLIQILRKMDNETIYRQNGNSFESIRTSSLNLKDEKDNVIATLVDTRIGAKKFPSGKDIFQVTQLSIGKTDLTIKNRTGEIINAHKPFFTTWNNVIEKVKDVLLRINATYHNPDTVQKTKISIGGYTEKGFENLNKIIKK